MQTDNEEKLASGKKSRPQSSYLQALEKLSNAAVLEKILKKTHAPLSLCQSTSYDQAETVCFISDSPEKNDLACLKDAKLLEKKLDYSEINITRRSAHNPARLNHMFRHIIPLKDTDSVQSFIDACETTQPSKKPSKKSR